jgi:DNA-binding transcriptional LysR family regulator
MNTQASASLDLLRALKMFAAAYELGSFSAAARELSITPGAVSKQIGMLEDLLGCRLFQRTTRHLSVTEEGRRLYATAHQPALQVEEAIAALSSENGPPSGALKVSLPIAFSRAVLLPLLSQFQERFAHITLDLRFENRHVELIAEAYDCAIGQLHDTDSSLIARPLAPLALFLCASPVYLDQHGKKLSVEELEHHRLIAFRSPNSGRVETWKLQGHDREVVVQPRASLVVTDTEAQTELAVAGCGITLLGAHHALPLMDAGKLVRVLPEFIARRGEIYVYYPARKNLPRRVSAFVEFLMEAARENALIKRIEAMLVAP